MQGSYGRDCQSAISAVAAMEVIIAMMNEMRLLSLRFWRTILKQSDHHTVLIHINWWSNYA